MHFRTFRVIANIALVAVWAVWDGMECILRHFESLQGLLWWRPSRPFGAVWMRISGAAGQFGSLRGLRWLWSGTFGVHFGAFGTVRVAASSASVAV